MDRRLGAEGDAADEVIGAVRAERVHEGAGPDVADARATGSRSVAGAADEGERAVDDADAGRGERLRGLASVKRASTLSRRPRRACPSSRQHAARASTPRAADRSIALSAASVRERASAIGEERDRLACAASAMPSMRPRGTGRRQVAVSERRAHPRGSRRAAHLRGAHGAKVTECCRSRACRARPSRRGRHPGCIRRHLA